MNTNATKAEPCSASHTGQTHSWRQHIHPDKLQCVKCFDTRRKEARHATRIRSLEDLARAVARKQSLTTDELRIFGCKCRPALIILNMSGSIILSLITRGLYIYEKPTDKNNGQDSQTQGQAD